MSGPKLKNCRNCVYGVFGRHERSGRINPNAWAQCTAPLPTEAIPLSAFEVENAMRHAARRSVFSYSAVKSMDCPTWSPAK